MADFNKLKDTIRGAIYPNGRGAISADKHQAALLDMADTMQETAAQVTELSAQNDGIKDLLGVSFLTDFPKREEKGVYINNVGAKITNASYEMYYVDLKVGETLFVNATAAIIVSVLSEYVNDSYKVIQISPLFDANDYIYTADRDMTIVVSTRIGSAKNWKIGRSSQITNTNEDIRDLKDKAIAVEGYRMIPSISESGIYIDRFGEIVSQSSYRLSEVISLKRGQTLRTKITATNLVAAIAKVKDGVYFPLVMGKGSDLQDYEFFAEENTEIVLSGRWEFYEVAIFDSVPLMEYLESSYTTAILEGETSDSHFLIAIPASSSSYEVILKTHNASGAKYDIALSNKLYFSPKGSHEVVFNIKKDTPFVIVLSSITETTYYRIEFKRISERGANVSEYENRLSEYEQKTEPYRAIPSVNYDELVVTSQEQYDSINEAIATLIKSGKKNINVIFRDGVFYFNQLNKINIKNIEDADVNLRFECDNATIMSDGSRYQRSDRKGSRENGWLFNYPSTFNVNDVVVVDGKHIYADDMQSFFTSDVTAHDKENKIYKAVIKNDVQSEVIGKTIIFTAWYEQISAIVTNYDSATKTIYFQTSSDMSYVINGDRNYGVDAVVRILNYSAYKPKSYRVIESGIILPMFNEYAIVCKYASFIEVSDCNIGSIILSNMNFVGASVSSSALISISQSSNVYILNSTFNAIGAAIQLTDANKALVEYCSFNRCGSPIVAKSDDCIIRHNTFVKSGYYWNAGRAVKFTGGRDFYIGHNKIEDFTYNAIQVNGGVGEFPSDWRGIIEYNLIEGKEWYNEPQLHQLIDSGAIQLSIINYPIIVRHNVINRYRTRASGRGIMMGGNCSRIVIYKNLIMNTPSHLGIDFYKGQEANTTYPNGVENIVMYNIVQSPIQMIGGDDYVNYSDYTKSNNDCVVGVNVIGCIGQALNNQVPVNNIESVAYAESQIIDNSFLTLENDNVMISADITSWRLSDFIKNRIVIRRAFVK